VFKEHVVRKYTRRQNNGRNKSKRNHVVSMRHFKQHKIILSVSTNPCSEAMHLTFLCVNIELLKLQKQNCFAAKQKLCKDAVEE